MRSLFGCWGLYQGGVFIAGIAKKVESREVAIGVEVIVMKEAMCFCRDQGMLQISLEGDSIQFPCSIKEREAQVRMGLVNKNLGNVMSELQEFCYYKITMVQTNENRVAFSLAKQVIFIESVFVWKERAPNCLMPFFLYDIP
ncbi:unnamed protein product [Ilex paraguariensis]|uniref:RNase H type-1 domain-containing protein n=1 Tax=Ilex paraguariensis TaxID=185542 RepID=A0ABC8RYQ5_9AQUA